MGTIRPLLPSHPSPLLTMVHQLGPKSQSVVAGSPSAAACSPSPSSVQLPAQLKRHAPYSHAHPPQGPHPPYVRRIQSDNLLQERMASDLMRKSIAAAALSGPGVMVGKNGLLIHQSSAPVFSTQPTDEGGGCNNIVLNDRGNGATSPKPISAKNPQMLLSDESLNEHEIVCIDTGRGEMLLGAGLGGVASSSALPSVPSGARTLVIGSVSGHQDPLSMRHTVMAKDTTNTAAPTSSQTISTPSPMAAVNKFVEKRRKFIMEAENWSRQLTANLGSKSAVHGPVGVVTSGFLPCSIAPVPIPSSSLSLSQKPSLQLSLTSSPSPSSSTSSASSSSAGGEGGGGGAKLSSLPPFLLAGSSPVAAWNYLPSSSSSPSPSSTSLSAAAAVLGAAYPTLQMVGASPGCVPTAKHLMQLGGDPAIIQAAIQNMIAGGASGGPDSSKILYIPPEFLLGAGGAAGFATIPPPSTTTATAATSLAGPPADQNQKQPPMSAHAAVTPPPIPSQAPQHHAHQMVRAETNASLFPSGKRPHPQDSKGRPPLPKRRRSNSLPDIINSVPPNNNNGGLNSSGGGGAVGGGPPIIPEEEEVVEGEGEEEEKYVVVTPPIKREWPVATTPIKDWQLKRGLSPVMLQEMKPPLHDPLLSSSSTSSPPPHPHPPNSHSHLLHPSHHHHHHHTHTPPPSLPPLPSLHPSSGPINNTAGHHLHLHQQHVPSVPLGSSPFQLSPAGLSLGQLPNMGGEDELGQGGMEEESQSDDGGSRHTPLPPPSPSEERSLPPFPTGRGPIQLWQFLLDLLLMPDKKELITWTGQGYEFKIQQPEGIAKLWGARKNKPKMNYDKLSRGLRYYYSKGIMDKVPGKKLTFKYTCNVQQYMHSKGLCVPGPAPSGPGATPPPPPPPSCLRSVLHEGNDM